VTPALARARALLDTPPPDPIPGQLDLEHTVTEQPVRIQRRRTKGWRKPGNTVIVTRPSRFGNPFTLAGAIEWLGAETPEQAREACHMAFRSWVRGSDQWWMGTEAAATRRRLLGALPELRGKNLACYCPLPADGQPDHCHAAVLLELANANTTP
jgi:hypothetical protein